MILIPILITSIALAVILFAKSTGLAAGVALAATLANVALIPSHTPPMFIAAASVGGCVLVLSAALARDRRIAASVRPQWPLLLFLMYITATSMRGQGLNGVVFTGAIGIMYILTSIATNTSAAHIRSGLAVAMSLAGVITIEFAIAIGEEFFGTHALWPRTNGQDVIESRINTLADWLPGRAMGSTSQPIPLGLLAAAALVVLTYFWIARGYRVFLIPVIFAAATLYFSGTRTAVFGVGVVLSAWVLTNASGRHTLRYVAAGLVAVCGIYLLDLPGLLGLTGVTGSESFSHRAGVLTTMSSLLDRPVVDVLFGSGYESVSDLFRTGVVGGVDGIVVFDQELLRTFAASGLIGLGLLVAAIIWGFARGDLGSRLMLGISVTGFFLFDVLSWQLTAVLFIIGASNPFSAPPQGDHEDGRALEVNRRAAIDVGDAR